MLMKTGAKLLDFGLAKPAMTGTSASATSAPVFSAAMTLPSPSPQSPLTTSGALVGTVQYMAPERFQGKDADARSDIFAFGSILYEMVTSKRPFFGKTQIKVVSAILEDDPVPASRLRPGLPPTIDYVIAACLQKIPDDRYQSAHDIALELKRVSEMPKQGPTRTQSISKLWIATALLIGVVVGGLALYSLSPKPPAQPIALSILPPSGVTLNFSGLYGAPAISPDGTRIMVVGSDSSGTRMLSLRSLDRTTLMPLPRNRGGFLSLLWCCRELFPM